MKNYFALLLPLLGLDALWLGLVAKNFYRKYLGYLMAEKFLLWPAAIFYLLYAFGLLVFALLPALQERSVWGAVWRGALLGLIAYGTYDLTNQATMAKWPLIVTVVDLAWGALVSAIVCAAAYYLVTKI